MRNAFNPSRLTRARRPRIIRGGPISPTRPSVVGRLNVWSSTPNETIARRYRRNYDRCAVSSDRLRNRLVSITPPAALGALGERIWSSRSDRYAAASGLIASHAWAQSITARPYRFDSRRHPVFYPIVYADYFVLCPFQCPACRSVTCRYCSFVSIYFTCGF